MGTLELHGWGATADDIERADTVVFDFDPAPQVAFADVAAAAVQCRNVLAAFGLESFAKTTGGKGLHVVVPLARRVPWPTVKAFARGVAELMARQSPGQFVTKAAKAAREGRIFIDWLRNARGATAVVPWSLRARDGATIAVPLSWNEVSADLVTASFTLRTIDLRLTAGGDPWPGYRTTRQTITVEMRRRLQHAA
jgi:bifunctional non-homologous end joining protein LigD